MDWSHHVAAALDAHSPGHWRSLSVAELQHVPRPVDVLAWSAGWRLQIPENWVRCACISYLFLLVDSAFPRSQPRIAAPEVQPEWTWPHVESGGILCLRKSALQASLDERIRDHLAWAFQLLNYTDQEVRHEFEREFATYWALHRTSGSRVPHALTILEPRRKTREVAIYLGEPKSRIVAAENREQLIGWLHNNGINPRQKDLATSLLAWLPRPWTPTDFPTRGEDVLHLLPEESISRLMRPGRPLPIIFGATTRSGIVFATVLLESAPKRDLVRGFRHWTHVPKDIIRGSFAKHSATRCRTTRVDGSWIHGRDHNREYPEVACRRVAIIGCGSLGSSIARLLAQAGVGEFLTMDGDSLSSANTSRHILGQKAINKNKARTLALVLGGDFPHIRSTEAVPAHFSAITEDQLSAVESCDLIVTAGIQVEGDAQVDEWRRRLSRPPIHVCTWVEPFAIVGHAVALIQSASIMEAFDPNDRVQFRVTEWPLESGALITEAGCGHVFQPHGAAELQGTASMASRLILDALSGRITSSVRRVYCGDMSGVERLGGKTRASFCPEASLTEYKWTGAQ